jgi:peptide/nickel transport system substrate-binding protein
MTSEPAPAPTSRHVPGWPFLAAILGGIAIVALASFALAGPLTGSGDPEPDRFVEAVIGSPSRVNPLFAHLNDVDRDLTALIFSGLTHLGPNGEVRPDLAQSWDIDSQGTTFTFHLRPDVTWPTGVPFSSADVIFTYSLLANPDVPNDPDVAPLWRQISCSAPDDLTVRCRLPEPFSPFLSFTTIGILPLHILENADPTTLLDNQFNQKPVGTGPYRLAQIDPVRAILTANPSYHLGPPIIDQIDLRFFPDSATAAAAMVQGDVDAVLLGPAASQPDFDAVASTYATKAYSANQTAYTLMYMNNAAPPLNNPDIRRAIALAVDSDSLIGDLLGGRAARAVSPIVPGTWAFNPDLEPYVHDPDNARQVLDDAGWRLPPDADVRQSDGVELRLALMTDQDPLRGALADEIARQLNEIGIGTTVVRQDSDELVTDFLIPRQYQAAIFGWNTGPDPDPYPAWHSSQITQSGRNLAAYLNEDADKLLEEARRVHDIDRRTAFYYDFQIIFHQDIPSLLLFYPVYTYFVSDDIDGIVLGTLFETGSRVAGIHEWSLKDSADILRP